MKERLLQVVSIGFVVLFVGAVWAAPEDGEHRGGMHHGNAGMMHGGPDFNRMVEHMSRRLELDDTQEQAIRNIVDAVKPEAEALREQAQFNREARHALDIAAADYDVQLQKLASRNGELVTQVTLLHGRVMAEINAELTDEQRAKFSEHRDKMGKHFRHHRGSGGSADHTMT